MRVTLLYNPTRFYRSGVTFLFEGHVDGIHNNMLVFITENEQAVNDQIHLQANSTTYDYNKYYLEFFYDGTCRKGFLHSVAFKDGFQVVEILEYQ